MASDLADRYEVGELEYHDLEVMAYRHMFEQDQLDYQNRHFDKDCLFRDYDWNSMYQEDKHVEDIGYISNLKAQLARDCKCINHNNKNKNHKKLK